jgi:hypothetical protein
MQWVGATLGVELACADPAPVTGTSRAVHVIAAIGFVGHNPALRALLAVLLDGRRSGLLNYGVASHPICTGLTRVRVAVSETIPTKPNKEGLNKRG